MDLDKAQRRRGGLSLPAVDLGQADANQIAHCSLDSIGPLEAARLAIERAGEIGIVRWADGASGRT
jgi:hypothetical protein